MRFNKIRPLTADDQQSAALLIRRQLQHRRDPPGTGRLKSRKDGMKNKKKEQAENRCVYLYVAWFFLVVQPKVLPAFEPTDRDS